VLAAVRRSAHFPISIPNRLGQDDTLAGGRLDAEVLVYFPDSVDSLYQIEPWYPALQQLHAAMPLVVVCQDSRVAASIGAASGLPVLTIARYATLDDLLARSEVKVALYASHAPRNFECLRFTSLIHVYIGHGESDKGVSASNQLKAYDYAFLPGEAAVDRIRLRLMKFDVDARTIVVGQPQNTDIPRAPRLDDRTSVLYAPTWEGAQPSVAYSSVVTHGVAMVRALLADGRFRVEVRPHPLSGVTSSAHAVATREITELVRAAGNGHRVVRPYSETIEQTFSRADVLITDVSAVTSQWLPTLRPLVVTRSPGEQTREADSGLLTALPRILAEETADAGEILARVVAEDGEEERRALVARYLSAFTPAEARARFIDACRQVAAERDVERDRLLALGGGAV
jgi:hypothetical protein